MPDPDGGNYEVVCLHWLGAFNDQINYPRGRWSGYYQVMRVVTLLLLLIASILSADVIGQSDRLYIEQLVGATRINGAPAQVEAGLIFVSIGDNNEKQERDRMRFPRFSANRVVT